MTIFDRVFRRHGGYHQRPTYPMYPQARIAPRPLCCPECGSPDQLQSLERRDFKVVGEAFVSDFGVRKFVEDGWSKPLADGKRFGMRCAACSWKLEDEGGDPAISHLDVWEKWEKAPPKLSSSSLKENG
jgi:rubredoxin